LRNCTSTNVTEPGAVATGCYAQSIKSILRSTLNPGIRSLPLPLPCLSGVNQLNSSSVLQIATVPMIQARGHQIIFRLSFFISHLSLPEKLVARRHVYPHA